MLKYLTYKAANAETPAVCYLFLEKGGEYTSSHFCDSEATEWEIDSADTTQWLLHRETFICFYTINKIGTKGVWESQNLTIHIYFF